ncbi:hypothetical protein F4818DRAFT_454178 [Hypoxylon cercidicola]|nr:hypothetical protein F4818DRAFT_454178 [Hypoxylon cercidicola]
MELSEAYIILGLAPGASRAEVEKAFRMKAFIYHPDRIVQCEDKDEQESRAKKATEDMKVINNARSLLTGAEGIQPEPAYTNGVSRTKNGDPRHKGDQGWSPNPRGPRHKGDQGWSPNPRGPRHRTFSGHGPAEFDMKFDTPINPDMANSAFEDSARSERVKRYAPTEDEYRELLQDLANLHAAVCKTADAIEILTHTRPCMTYWDQIWLTFHMAGSTTEGVWDIVRYKWHKMLQETARIGPGEWENVEGFVKSARETINKCDRILSSWESHRERESCLRLYRALGEFPIAKRKLCDPSWQAQDRLMRASMYSI